MKTSICIMTYLRPDFLDKQLEAIYANNPDEILIGHLENEHTAVFNTMDSFHEYEFIRFKKDPGLQSKFLLALSATNDYVLLLDDDVLIGDNFLDFAKENYQDNELWGAMGMDVRDDGYYDNYFPRSHYPNHKYTTNYLGQAWFGKKEYFSYYWNSPFPFDDVRSGEDMWLSQECRKMGLNTVVPPHPKSEKDKWMSVDNLATGERALHNREDSHREIREHIIQNDKTLNKEFD